jgi:two-component system phosphate regulon sensor histidine kinase PhoR
MQCTRHGGGKRLTFPKAMLIKVNAAQCCDITANFEDEKRLIIRDSFNKMDKKGSSGQVVRLGLMICSIALLLVLQFFWLVNLYEQSVVGFRRESSALFTSAILSLRDSLFQIEVARGIPIDKEPRRNFKQRTEVRIIHSERGKKVMGWSDNVDDDLGSHKFILTIRDDDTLSIALLQKRFGRLLHQAGYPYAYFVRHTERPQVDTLQRLPLDLTRALFIKSEEYLHQNAFEDTVVTETIRQGPIHEYAAVFPSMRSKFIGKMASQILFSGFLTLITIAAFIILYNSLRSQERLIEMKNDFISNVTHELKTPIATVSVAIEALKDFHALKNPTRTAEYLGIAQHELNRLSLMTDKILKTSVFEQQGVTFIPGVVKFDELVQQVLQSLTVVLEKKHIATSLQLKGDQFDLQGSDMHLTNVVYNLLENAIKYSPENTAIAIDLAEHDSELVLAVRDHGIGIDPAHHKRIFEKFFRVPAGDVHNTRGYGLGLNYVANVVRSHNGTVTLESSPGEGSCFTLRLPKTHGG